MKPPAPALEKILELEGPCLRLAAPDAWADANGHMNMRWYAAVFDDAGDDLHERIGLTTEYHREHRTGTVDLEHNTRFLNEIMPRDNLAAYARLVARSPKRLHYLMFLVDETRGRPAAIFECMNAAR